MMTTEEEQKVLNLIQGMRALGVNPLKESGALVIATFLAGGPTNFITSTWDSINEMRWNTGDKTSWYSEDKFHGHILYFTYIEGEEVAVVLTAGDESIEYISPSQFIKAIQ
jgi:hypothetical protein